MLLGRYTKACQRMCSCFVDLDKHLVNFNKITGKGKVKSAY